MSKYALIDHILATIEQGRFQRVCNSFLQSEYHGELHAPGAVDGKDKTKKGKPDTYIILPNGTYILAECTTKDANDTKGFEEKLRSDLEDCLNFTAMGIAQEDVQQIALCFNSSANISFANELKEIAGAKGISLRLIGIESLSVYLRGKGRKYAKDYLNVPYDSGQILSKQEFLAHYHIKNLSTPLDTPVLGREQELKELDEMLFQENMIIIKGPPGVGKSRIALQAIDSFISRYPQYTPYYTFPGSGSISEDLIDYLEPGKSYVLFIDDANRQIENLLSVIAQFISGGRTIKVVMTVRDYAKEDVLREIRSMLPKVFTLEKLSDDTIRTILKNEPFVINNQTATDKIMTISAGNPRMAIMAANNFKRSGDIKTISDAASVYDEYFKSIITEKQIFHNKLTLKVLGLISFFYTLDLEDEKDREMIGNFGITISDFIDITDQLEELEMIEKYQEVTKIAEQVMSTYFFYLVFLKERLISIDLLIEFAFPYYYRRIKDTFIPAADAFGATNTITPFQEPLRKYIQSVHEDKERSIFFFEVFGPYFRTEMFLFIAGQIERINPSGKDLVFTNTQKSNFLVVNEPLFHLLEVGMKSQDLQFVKLSLEYATRYITKHPEQLDELVLLLKDAFFPTIDDRDKQFQRQKEFHDHFKNKKNEQISGIIHFYVGNHIFLSDYYPNSMFQHDGNNWHLNADLQTLRAAFWQQLITLFETDKPMAQNLILEHLDHRQRAHEILLKLDEPLLIELIDTKMDPNDFDDCYLVDEFAKPVYKYPELPTRELTDRRFQFTNEIFQLYKNIIYDRSVRRKKRAHTDWRRTDALKLRFIKKTVRINHFKDFLAFYAKIEILVRSKFIHRFHLYYGFGAVIDNCFEQDIDFGFQCFEHYLSKGNIVGYTGGTFFNRIFHQHPQYHKKLLATLQKYDYTSRQRWLENYYQWLPETLVDQETTNSILQFYGTLTGPIEIFPKQWDNFLKFEPSIYALLLSILAEKKQTDPQFTYTLFSGFFKKAPESLLDHIELCKKAYLQQTDQKRNFDHDSGDLIALLEKDRSFLYELVRNDLDRYELSFTRGAHDLTCIWTFDDAEKIVYQSLIIIRSHRNYAPFSSPASSFFGGLNEQDQQRAYQVLEKMITDHPEDERMLSTVFDILRNVLRNYHFEAIRFFVQLNNDIDLFKKVRWLNNHFSSSGNEIWSDHKAIEYRNIFNAIHELNDPVRYLNHYDYLESCIRKEQRNSEWERKLYFRGHR